MASLVIKTFLVIFLLVFADISSGRVKGFHDEVVKAFPTNEGRLFKKKMRKLVAVDDYKKPEPNPKHERKPGGGN